MKKILLFLLPLCLLFSFSAFAYMGENYVEKAKDVVTSNDERCPVYAETPLKEVKRAPFEISLRWNLLDFPSSGPPQVRTENLDIAVNLNLSQSLFAYGWIGTRTTRKTDYVYENTSREYDPEWKSRMIFAGFGIYITPTLKFFGGFGKIVLENADGSAPDLNVANERGLAYDIPFFQNKLEISYRVVEAEVAGESIPVEDAPASGSYNALAISLTVPID